MHKLTLTNTLTSPLTLGEPGDITITLLPKETRAVDFTDAEFATLEPQMNKLHKAGWLTGAGEDPPEAAPSKEYTKTPDTLVPGRESSSSLTETRIPTDPPLVPPAVNYPTETSSFTETPVVPEQPAPPPPAYEKKKNR